MSGSNNKYPNLALTEKNAAEWSRVSSRKAFGAALAEIAPQMPELIVLAADVAASAGLTEFAQKFPDQFINTGIAEQNMLAVASGLAKYGRRVIAASFAPFASMRCFEVMRTYVGYMSLDVIVVGLASGLSMGTGGATHWGLEDVALARAIPGMTVVAPADCGETVKALVALCERGGPAYLRLTGVGGNPVVYKEEYDFELGRGIVLRDTAGESGARDVALIASGPMVREAVRAARALARDKITYAVVDMHTIKPLDTKLIDCLAATSRLIVTAEEHSLIGGLGSAVAEHLAERGSAPKLVRVALPDEFGKAGEYKYLMEQFGLTAEGIVERVREGLG